MDRFLVKSTKNNLMFSDVNGAVCVWGPFGCGKTTWVHQEFDVLEINYDDPKEFMSRVPASRWVLIDSLDPTAFSDWFTRSKTIVIHSRPIDGLFNYEFPTKKNLRDLFGSRDIHMDPKEYLVSQMSSPGDPLDAIHKCGAEHGNGVGIIFENFSSVCSLDESIELLESLSWASVLDQKIYSGQWDYETLKYFNFFAFSKPLSVIRGRFRGQPASATIWSKFLNVCMKRKKLKEAGLDYETVELVREYAIHEQNPLGLAKDSIDSLKIGDLKGRLKAKTVQKLKKDAGRR